MASPDSPLDLMVRQIRFEGKGINSYELVDPEGATLPPFTAGAHIDIHLKGGTVRQYSLSNSPSERHRYVIAVLRDEADYVHWPENPFNLRLDAAGLGSFSPGRRIIPAQI